ELNLVRAGARHVEVVERIAVGRNRRRIAYAVGVLPKRRFGREEASQRVPVRLRRFAPIGPNGVPAVAQALLIGVAVLRDDRGNPLRMLERDPKADGRAVIENVDCEPLQVHDLREASYYLGQLCERVWKRVARRHIGLPEPRQVWRNDVKAIGKQRDEMPKHMAAGRETMQQQQRWRVG